MDDILASIRKILNEDEGSAGPATKPGTRVEPLVLTEEMLVSEPQASLPEAPLPQAPPPPRGAARGGARPRGHSRLGG
jgi:hypothetical protein